MTDIERMEGISNIKDAVHDLLEDGYDEEDIIRYVRKFKETKC